MTRTYRRAYDDGWEGWCPHVVVEENPKVRVSALLGPDGRPLLLEYEKHPVGFDLRARPRGAE